MFLYPCALCWNLFSRQWLWALPGLASLIFLLSRTTSTVVFSVWKLSFQIFCCFLVSSVDKQVYSCYSIIALKRYIIFKIVYISAFLGCRHLVLHCKTELLIWGYSCHIPHHKETFNFGSLAIFRFIATWIYIPSSQGYGFTSSHIWMWELDHKEGWAPKNWCFWTVVLEKTLESPLDCKDIQPVHPKGSVLGVQWKDWCWRWNSNTIGQYSNTDVKNWLVGKDPDVGKDWRQEEKGTTGDEMVAWHHRLNEHEFEWTPGAGDGQGGLACCSPWDLKVSDTTEQLNWTEYIYN